MLAAPLVAVALLAQVDELRLLPLDDPAIQYSIGPVHDRIAALQQRINQGKLRFRYDPQHGYLEAVLNALGVPASSQVLVFSKTSFQSPKISPRMPRAIYHSDEVAVGWVRGGDVLEIASIDPRQGVIFYTLDQDEAEHPVFVRRGECLQCHIGASTLGIPGLVVRSMHVERSGAQILSAKAYITDHRSPLDHRWGGWYVTGTSGRQLHMGNQWIETGSDPAAMDLSAGSNVTTLKSYFDTGLYLRPDSDIVSLLVLEHQTRAANLLTRLGWEARLGGDIQPLVDEVVRYFLFADEAPLTEPVHGGSDYAAEFAKAGPRDRRGRSLREFDLTRRMFRYPCSFMIYSAQFDALPPEARNSVVRKLRESLSGPGPDRQAILEILADTRPELKIR